MKYKDALMPVITALSMAWILLAVILYFACKASLTYVVTFNQSQLVAQFVGQLSAHQLSDAELTQKTDAFSAALKIALNDYTNTHPVLVLNSADVMSGERDITDNIAVMVAKQMRAKP